ISARPLPESVLPGFLRLIGERLPRRALPCRRHAAAAGHGGARGRRPPWPRLTARRMIMETPVRASPVRASPVRASPVRASPVLASPVLAGPVLADFSLPPELEAHEPPEARGIARDGVRMLVSRRHTGEISHHRFTELPGLLLPGDLLVVNISATLPAAVACEPGRAVHFSTPLPDGSWLAELRARRGPATVRHSGGFPGQELTLPGGAVLKLGTRVTGRLWRVRLSTAVPPYLLRHGTAIRYSYVDR